MSLFNVRPAKKVKMVGQPGLPAHESKLRELTDEEINGKYKENFKNLKNSIQNLFVK